MSHSWSDDGGQKHARLCEYSAEREARGGTCSGGPCRIWLDKACIDQLNIDASLSSLPVFLSGCQELLVLAGATYPSRLWCVMELFVFLRMGGARENMHVKPLTESDVLQFTQFDAARARCFLDADRQRLLAVIEACFGTFTSFKCVCKTNPRHRVPMLRATHAPRATLTQRATPPRACRVLDLPPH